MTTLSFERAGVARLHLTLVQQAGRPAGRPARPRGAARPSPAGEGRPGPLADRLHALAHRAGAGRPAALTAAPGGACRSCRGRSSSRTSPAWPSTWSAWAGCRIGGRTTWRRCARPRSPAAPRRSTATSSPSTGWACLGDRRPTLDVTRVTESPPGGGPVGEQPRGFWAAAAAEPDRVAVIDPAGRTWSAGEVLADANRIVHALRARGLVAGDPVATLLPNRAEVLEMLLAVFQAGLELRPAQQQPHRPRGGLHPGRLGGQGAGRRRALRRRGRRGRRGGRSCRPAAGCRSARSPASPRSATPLADQPDHHARRPGRRAVHAVHVGHDRSTQGGAAGPARVQPRDVGRAVQRQPVPLRHRAGRRLRCTS